MRIYSVIFTIFIWKNNRQSGNDHIFTNIVKLSVFILRIFYHGLQSTDHSYFLNLSDIAFIIALKMPCLSRSFFLLISWGFDSQSHHWNKKKCALYLIIRNPSVNRAHCLDLNLNDQKTSHWYWDIPGMLKTFTIPKL